jgi:hypothetical protein
VHRALLLLLGLLLRLDAAARGVGSARLTLRRRIDGTLRCGAVSTLWREGVRVTGGAGTGLRISDGATTDSLCKMAWTLWRCAGVIWML